MDVKTAKKILANRAIMEAFVEGKTIQAYIGSFGVEWVDLCTPWFDGEPEHYRIKPEPVELEVWYHDKTGGTMYTTNHIAESDEYMMGQGFRKMRVREVV